MTQLELVYHEQIIDKTGQNMRRTVVAVSSSHTALCEHCVEIGGTIGEIGCGKTTYHTIQESEIVIVPSKS